MMNREQCIDPDPKRRVLSDHDSHLLQSLVVNIIMVICLTQNKYILLFYIFMCKLVLSKLLSYDNATAAYADVSWT